MKTGLTQLTCKRCGYQWFPRGPVVRVCPKCKSPYWDIAKKFKTIITALVLLFISGCGVQDVNVVYSTQDEITAMFPQWGMVLSGYAIGDWRKCTIYIVTPEDFDVKFPGGGYDSNHGIFFSSWEQMFAHEKTHCEGYENDF